MVRIAFLAVAQAHQYLHWLPAALELSKRRGVRVHVLCPSWAGLRFIRKYDRKRRLRLIWTPVQREKIGLFDLPRRRIFHQKYDWLLRRYRVVVTTETTSTRLRRDPKFRAKLIRIRHGAGDTATRVDDERLRDFDLSLVGFSDGELDKLLARPLYYYHV